jgi:hypothetical protein
MVRMGYRQECRLSSLLFFAGLLWFTTETSDIAIHESLQQAHGWISVTPDEGSSRKFLVIVVGLWVYTAGLLVDDDQTDQVL